MGNLEALPLDGLMLAPTILVLLGLALLAFQSQGRSFASAYWFASAFCCVAFSLIVDALLDGTSHAAQHYLGDLILLPAGFLVSFGLAAHLGFAFPLWRAFLICCAGTIGYFYFTFSASTIESRALSVLLAVSATIMIALPRAFVAPAYHEERPLVLAMASYAFMLAVISISMFGFSDTRLTTSQFNTSLSVSLVKLLTVAGALMIYLALMRSYVRKVVADFSGE